MKRGQITIFLIAALIIIGVLAFTIFILRNALPDTATPTLELPTGKSNLTLCLEDAGRNVIMSAMMEGGVNIDEIPRQPEWGSGAYGPSIYWNNPPMQYGESPSRFSPRPYYTDPGTGEKILVGIQRGRDMFDWTTPLPARLPLSFVSDINTNVFGTLTFEPLCSLTGANRPNADGSGTNTCLLGTYRFPASSPILSFQELIEERITQTVLNNSDTCGNTERVTVTFGESDVVIRASNESARIPIRLKAMYNAARYFARNEITDPDFPLRPPPGVPPTYEWKPPINGCPLNQNGGNCLLNGMIVKVENRFDPCERLANNIADMNFCGAPGESAVNIELSGWNEPITIVSIIDTTVRIDGINPEFRFAVRNRYPYVDSSFSTNAVFPETPFSTTPAIPHLAAPIEMTCDSTTRNAGTILPEKISVGFDVDELPMKFIARRLGAEAFGNTPVTFSGSQVYSLSDAATLATVTDCSPSSSGSLGECEISIGVNCRHWRDSGLSTASTSLPVPFELIFCSDNKIPPENAQSPFEWRTLFSTLHPDFTLPTPSGTGDEWPRNCRRVWFSIDDQPDLGLCNGNGLPEPADCICNHPTAGIAEIDKGNICDLT